jgi:Fe-S oxidoreductase
MLEAKHDLSLQVAAPLVAQIHEQPPGGVIVASGTSCRHQIDDLTSAHPQHMAELLADALPK